MNKEKKLNYQKLLNIAFILSLITIFYNIIEGVISTFFGFSDETIALFGFGVDSFVEVISGLGIAHMVWRMKSTSVDSIDKFERQALYITGTAFFILTAGLVAGSILNIIYKVTPDTTIPGVVISILSILTMWILYKYKLNIGTELKSDPIISDANCTKTCFYLSFILLASSVLYHFFKINYIDIAGAIGIAFFSYKEGKEAFEKAKSNKLSCSCDSCCK